MAMKKKRLAMSAKHGFDNNDVRAYEHICREMEAAYDFGYNPMVQENQ